MSEHDAVMTAEKKSDSDAIVASAVTTAEAGALDASMSAIGTSHSGSLEATASAVGISRVSGDAAASMSAVGIMTAGGNGNISASYASAFLASEGMNVSMSATPLVMAKRITFEQSAAAAVVATEAHVNRGWIGFVLSPRVTISEDSRVLISGKSALWLALAVLGGFGLVALAASAGADRIARSVPRFGFRRG